MNNSTSLARVIVRQIIEAGITDVVVSPGSRNAPLSLAFFAESKRGLIKLHVRIDERTAAFFALGIIKATGRPVPIVCTSGTAVANYHPAVLEASHTNAPLLVLTADRPAILRKTGANQTTEQARIYGKAVRYFADIDGPVFPMELPFDSLRSGPVHLNVQFDEPMLPDDSDQWLDEIVISAKAFETRTKPTTLKSDANRGVLVIGHDRGGLNVESVRKFAKELGWPIIAEDPLTFADAVAHAINDAHHTISITVCFADVLTISDAILSSDYASVFAPDSTSDSMAHFAKTHATAHGMADADVTATNGPTITAHGTDDGTAHATVTFYCNLS